MRQRIITWLSALSLILALLSLWVASRHASHAAPESHLDFVFREVRLKRTALSDALQMMRDRAGVNIAVDWKSLNQAGVTESSPVDLDLQNVSVLGVLEAMLDQFQTQVRLGYHLDRDVVVIDAGYSWQGTPPRLEAHVYPVEDLLDLPSGTDQAVVDDNVRDDRASNLIKLLHEAEGSESISAEAWAGRLFVIGTAGQHLSVRRVLDSLRLEAKRSGHSPLNPGAEGN